MKTCRTTPRYRSAVAASMRCAQEVVIHFPQDLTQFRDDRLFSVSFRAHREKSFFALQPDTFKLQRHR
jgi:hypothetical protein